MTLEKLRRTWSARQAHYARRRINGRAAPLSLTEERAVRIWRFTEIQSLPADERSMAYREVRDWEAPTVIR